jgi:hypothetical protein
MLKKHTMLALLGTALLAIPAAAQTGSGASSDQPAASSGSSSAGSTASAPASGSAQFITQAQSGQWRASKLVGVDVYGQNNEKIGDIKEVLVDKSGAAKAAVIGVGGFLGIGEKDVAVPFNALQWSDQPAPRAASGAPSGTGMSGGSGTGGTGTTGTGAAAGSTGSGSARNADYPDHAMLPGMTKDQLKNAPEFKFASDTSSSSNSGSGMRPTGSNPGTSR